jgi:hypothetical protein
MLSFTRNSSSKTLCSLFLEKHEKEMKNVLDALEFLMLPVHKELISILLQGKRRK